VPDGLSQLAGDLDPSHLRPTLAAEPSFGPLVVLGVRRVSGGVDSRLDERPSQVRGAFSRKRSPVILLTGLVDPGAQPRVAAQFLGEENLEMSPISEAMVKPRIQAIPGMVVSRGT